MHWGGMKARSSCAGRKIPDYEGGFLLDGGVHFVAGLRYMLAAVGEDIKSLAAFTSLQQKKLAPVDTVHGIASTLNGSGTLCISFGTEFKSRLEVEVGRWHIARDDDR